MITRSRQLTSSKVFVILGGIYDSTGWVYALGAYFWWLEGLQLSAGQLILLAVVVQVAALAAEVPAGVLADLLGRRRTIVAGYFGLGLAFVITGVSSSLLVITFGHGLAGLAWALSSGADTAWLSHEVEQEAKTSGEEGSNDDLVATALLERHRLGMALASVGLVLAIIVGLWSPRVVAAAAGVTTMAVAVAAFFLMKETNFQAGTTRGETFFSTLRAGGAVVWSRQRLRLVVVVALALASTNEVLDSLGLKRFVDVGGVDDLGIAQLGGWFLAAVVAGFTVNTLVARRLAGGFAVGRLASALFVAAGLAVVTAAWSDWWLVVGAGLVVQDSARETFDPILESWVNRDALAEVRATTHSVVAQVEALASIVGASVWGLLAEVSSIPVVFYGVAAVLLVVGGLIDRRLASAEAGTKPATVSS